MKTKSNKPQNKIKSPSKKQLDKNEQIALIEAIIKAKKFDYKSLELKLEFLISDAIYSNNAYEIGSASDKLNTLRGYINACEDIKIILTGTQTFKE